MSPVTLSKSRYLNGLQCPKLLWIATNEPARIPAPDAGTQHIFDQGHLVGELAKKLFPGGIDVPADDFKGNLATTQKLLRQRQPLFEAGVLSGHVYSRVDVLRPAQEDEWDIIEVKSSTAVKEVNVHDVSFQKLCCEDNGLKIRNCYLACINNHYVRNGEINPEELFTVHNISGEVMAAGDGIRERIGQMFEVIGQPSCPQVTIGPHCTDPYDCSLSECWEGLPEHNVFTLYYGGKKAHDLYQNGVVNIADIPFDCKLNDKQCIQCGCVSSGQPHINASSLKQFLNSLRYPLYYLDFETINPAVPLFDGTRPYQNIPFQFSLHMQTKPGGATQHRGYLADGPQDPRPELLARLQKAIGIEGSIIVYNQSFEQRVLQELGAAFPEYAEWVEMVTARLVDLLVPFRSFHYYHPDQKGSASIKSVLPAISGQGYEGMEIASGDIASLAFLAMYHGDSQVCKEECAKVRRNLLDYCRLDTEGMVRIIARLAEITR
jgi:hypothetical protein